MSILKVKVQSHRTSEDSGFGVRVYFLVADHQAPGTPGSDCKLVLTVVTPNLLLGIVIDE